jgi:hypothetical protein
MLPDRTLFNVLKRHGVPFVVVGGHAVNFHGYERMTEDADAVWIRSADSEAKLLAALEEVGACRIGREIDPATGIEQLHPVSKSFVHANHLMMLWTNFGFLDLFDYIPGYPEEDPQSLVEGSVEADGLLFVSKSWLRRMKEKAGRDKDLLDLKRMSSD